MSQIELKDDFEIIEEGHEYELPVYEVVEGKGLQQVDGVHTVQFVRGSKDPNDKDSKRVGTLHEHLLAMMISDLQYKNSEVPSRETNLAITNLQQAYHWMVQRQVERSKRNVQGTYKK